MQGTGSHTAAALVQLDDTQQAFERDTSLRLVREHIERNFTRRISLSEAADVAGFERTYFSAYFHKKVGITYTRWLNALRVSRSLDLLRSTIMPISNIARQVGYRDLRTYERNFKRLVGLTPSEFRARS